MPETKCKLCGKLKMWHNPPNLNCPEGKGIKSMGVMFYDSYSSDTFESSVAKKPKIKVSSAKQKGRELQKYMANKIGELLNIKVGKDELIESREMGQAGVDVKLIGIARVNFPWSVESKCGNSTSFSGAVDQAKKNTMEGTQWLLISRRDRDKAVISLDAEVFFELLKLINDEVKGIKK